MDFGLHRFLEMFEDRFGRHPTTGLLLVIGLAIFGVCLHLIYTDIAKPIYGLVTQLIQLTNWNMAVSLTPNAILAAAAAGATVLILSLALHYYFKKRLLAALAEEEEEILEMISTIGKNSESIHKGMTAATAEIRSTTEKLNAARDTLNRATASINAPKS